jgi:hypothetical protein
MYVVMYVVLQVENMVPNIMVPNNMLVELA